MQIQVYVKSVRLRRIYKIRVFPIKMYFRDPVENIYNQIFPACVYVRIAAAGLTNIDSSNLI